LHSLLYSNHLINTLHVVVEPFFISLYFLLGCLEEILQVLNRDDSKTRRASVFLSCDSQTSLLEVRFVFTFMLGQPYSLYFESMFVFSLKKKGG
jgi:hypothetical protein